jgi:hypothetical protein
MMRFAVTMSPKFVGEDIGIDEPQTSSVVFGEGLFAYPRVF